MVDVSAPTPQPWTPQFPASSVTRPCGICSRTERRLHPISRAEFLQAILRQSGIRAQSVQYSKLADARKTNPPTTDLPFLKRAGFRDEREFRIICESRKSKRQTLAVPIPLSCIQRITLSPELPKGESDGVKKALHALPGCGSIKIVRSTLTGNAEWKRFADGAS